MYGDRIKYLREKAGLTQEELANRVKIKRASLSHYEKNRREPPYKVVKKIADFFEVSVDWILDEENSAIKGPNLDLKKLLKEKELTWGDEKLSEEDQETLRRIILALLDRG